MKLVKSGILSYHTGNAPHTADLPTLLFIHGAGSSGIYWQNQITALSAMANVIALDLPGRGQSGGSGADSIDSYAQNVVDFINDIKPDKLVLAGFSMGGAIVLNLLTSNPGLCRATILIATGAKLKVHPVVFDAIENDFPRYLELVRDTARSPKTDPAVIQPVIEDRAACNPKVAAGDFRACDKFDIRDQISGIKTPVLIISAQDDLLTPPKFSDFLENNIPTTKRVHIKDAGHLVAVEQADKVNKAIGDFLLENF